MNIKEKFLQQLDALDFSKEFVIDLLNKRRYSYRVFSKSVILWEYC